MSSAALVITGAIVLINSRPSSGVAMARPFAPDSSIVGSIFPDYGFTTSDGRHHRISEFRGRYVLLDVWGTWCTGCMSELASMHRAYETFRPRGLEILGFAFENVFVADPNDPTKFASMAAARKSRADSIMRTLPWPQTSTYVTQRPGEEIIDSLMSRLRVTSRGFPTKVLIGPDGRVLEDRSSRLSGDSLAFVLDRLMPHRITENSAQERISK